MILLQLTGLSGAGKTTIANYVKEHLQHLGHKIELLDGDIIRKNLSKDLGFSKNDRCENIRRMGFIADILTRNNIIVLIAAINPYEDIRQELRQNYGAKTVWIKCNLETLKQRDTKGLYKRAFLPENHPEKIYNLTGVNDIYEIPLNADLVIETTTESIAQSAQKVINFVVENLQDLH
ncbi:adenylyl-sulfate kinase [Emticicia sp. SJ17W-69]|uniref:adenylyl-sulfate kinase n=1 Tax=Emticicia sp. SJ17W-69 TaxID=3421657 RepID=UPI003EBC1728